MAREGRLSGDTQLKTSEITVPGRDESFRLPAGRPTPAGGGQEEGLKWSSQSVPKVGPPRELGRGYFLCWRIGVQISEWAELLKKKKKKLAKK